MNTTINRIAMLWAGVSLGGSLLAGPAKFQVADLSLPLALQVGRVQFLWVMYGELLCLAAIIACWLWSFRRVEMKPSRMSVRLLLMVFVLFAIQHLVLMKPLQARSEQIIAGGEAGESHLHLVYIVVEAIRFLLLLVVGFLPGGEKRAVTN